MVFDELKPSKLDVLTFMEQIKKCKIGKKNDYSYNQNKQFNMGNTKRLEDPIEAANALLKREYKEIFDYELKTAVFIPSAFISNEYKKHMPTMKDVDVIISKTHQVLENNHCEHWIKSQLPFMGKDPESIKTWIKKMKILFLVNSSLKESSKEVFKPTEEQTGKSLKDFAHICSECLELGDGLYAKINNRDHKNITKWLRSEDFTSHLMKDDLLNEHMKYLFELKYSEIIGEQAERFLFDVFAKENSATLSDFVILRSLHIFTSPPKLGKNKEYDFLLLSAERKLIIAIEVKSNSSEENIKSALTQLQSTKMLFEKKFSDILDDKWTFYPVVFVKTSYSEVSLEIKQNHFINAETEFCKWFDENIDKNYPKLSGLKNQEEIKTARIQLRNVIKILVFCVHINKKSSPSNVSPGPLTPSKLVQYFQEVIDTISTTDIIMFYSEYQLSVLYSDVKMRLIDGGYGTGKSILLQEKAQMLARQGEKVLFMVHPSNPPSLFQLKLEEIFSREDLCQKNITVDNYENLEKYKDDTDHHFFFDEYKLNGQEDQPDPLYYILEQRIKVNKLFWLVHHREDAYNYTEENLKIPEYFNHDINLNVCFRSSKRVVEELQKIENLDERAKVETLVNAPEGINPIIVNSVEEAIEEAFLNNFLIREDPQNGTQHGILYYITDKDRDFQETYKELSEVCQNQNVNVKAYSSSMELESECNYLKHLGKTNSILVVSGDCVMEGFEWPIIILDTRNIADKYTTNQCFRSIVSFIAIVDEEAGDI